MTAPAPDTTKRLALDDPNRLGPLKAAILRGLERKRLADEAHRKAAS